MKTKLRMRLEIKEISAEGSFEGMLSPYGNVDLGGDVVLPGAFSKNINEKGAKRPLLWQHKTDMPIGDLSLEDTPEGLWCRGQLLMSLPEAQKAHLLIKARIVKGLSIGFETIKEVMEKGVRKLQEIKLYEGSVVTFPMNEAALITSVKGPKEGKGDFNDDLTGIQLSDAGDQMRCALSCALGCITWSDLTREEKSTAAETVIQQFSDAYMAYYPPYLDMLAQEYGEMETWNAKILETKYGARISASMKETMKSACAQIKSGQEQVTSGHQTLVALMADEAGMMDTTAEAAGIPATPEAKAAAPKPEPVEIHSAAEILNALESMRSFIPAA